MAKNRNKFICTSCNMEFPKWAGKCGNCGEWNTVIPLEPAKTTGSETKALFLEEIERSDVKRLVTGIDEFDLVVGGGMVPGSAILVGGDPGIGKSTLALQIAGNLTTLYFSGEESPAQIRSRGERLEIPMKNILVSNGVSVDDIGNLVNNHRPECVIIDSIQTLHVQDIPGSAGSVAQIREACSRMVDLAKKCNIPFILIGHITKDGAIAGPKILEHTVDTVLYFEGDFTREYRMLRAFKNRFGSVNEIGLFRMTEKGLKQVKDRNSVFIDYLSADTSGAAVSASIEGSRTILFEVQSLVSFSSFSNPRRMTDGFDLNRLIIITAVLERHGSLKLGDYDVFINIAGGFRITDTASDLAVAMAVASSLKDVSIPLSTGFMGEIALSGQIRPVSHCYRRAQEFFRSGFKSVMAARGDAETIKDAGFQGEIIGVGTIGEAMDYLF